MRRYNVCVVSSLRDLLIEYPPIMLEAIAEGWRIALTDEQLPEIVDRLVAEMSDREALEAVVGRLSAAEQEALAFVVAKGQVRGHILGRKYGRIRHLGPGRLEWEQAWRNPDTPTEQLWFLGLIYRSFGVDEGYHGEIFIVPPEISNALPQMSPPLSAFRVEPTPIPAFVRDDRDGLAHDAFAILSHLRNHAVRAKRGALAKHELARVLPRLAIQDAERLRFLHHLCERGHLICTEEGLWQLTQRAAEWLRNGDIARCRSLYRAWLEDTDWNELCMMPSVRCESTGWRNEPVLARKGVVGHLGRCTAEVWFSVDSLVQSIHDVDPDFMRPDGDYDSWYIRDVGTGQYLMGYSNWDKVEGAFIRYLLQCPLLWLGVVAIGRRQEKGDAYGFMLTVRGAAILGLWEAASGEECSSRGLFSDRFVMSPDFQVTVPLLASWYDRFLLERFSRWVGEQGGVAHYQIDAASLRLALEKGVTVRQIQTFLRRVTGGQVPEQVLRALQAWGRGAEYSLHTPPS